MLDAAALIASVAFLVVALADYTRAIWRRRISEVELERAHSELRTALFEEEMAEARLVRQLGHESRLRAEMGLRDGASD